MIPRLLESPDPAIRRLAGDPHADVMTSRRVRTLLDFPDVHPYRKWYGAHWRIVELADLGVPPGTPEVEPGVERVLTWLVSPRRRFTTVNGLVRRCASQEGNALYACSRLGYASDPRAGKLAAWLLEWQWPDGGWNCDVKASGRRSSFHETVTPALGLAAYHEATGDPGALAAARRSGELFLEHRLFRSLADGEVIHRSWTQPHYPPYWHYDVLQGLRLLDVLGLITDVRAGEAIELLEHSRGADGRFSGPAWWSSKRPAAVDWGRGPENEMLNLRVEAILQAGRRR